MKKKSRDYRIINRLITRRLVASLTEYQRGRECIIKFKFETPEEYQRRQIQKAIDLFIK